MTEVQRDHLNDIMRSIQRKFVESSLNAVIDARNETDGLDKVVTSIALKCRENGTTFSEPLVRELIIEITEKVGY
jgi:hypothetical protein